MGVVAFALLASGIYSLIERVLVVLVVVMSVVFILTAVLVRPNIGDILAGIFAPGIPSGSLVTVVALIGTTVVTYNFFLHSSSVQDKWPESVPTDEALGQARFDTGASIVLGRHYYAGDHRDRRGGLFRHRHRDRGRRPDGPATRTASGTGG